MAAFGGADTSVDPLDSENAVVASASEAVTLEVIEDADHTYNVFDPETSSAQQVIDLTAAWFAEKL